MWGEVASSALERVGENVSADLERARARRQAIIDASVQDMFTSGKEAFSKRQLEREGIQDNIQYFKSMGFDRDTIEQLVSLSSTEIDKIKLSLDDGRKAALLQQKPDQSQLEYDPYSILPNRTDPRNLENAEIFVENISPAARTEAINALPLGERDRLLQKAKGLGIVIMDKNKSLEENKAMAKEAILKVQRMEQVEESQTSDYSKWEDSVLANVIGKIDHTKFPDSEAEKSFGDNFRTSLRDNFGWAGGEQEEALRQAALLFPGKSAAELRSVLDPTLYERPETIAPLEYEIGYTELEQRQIKTAAVTLDKVTLELDILRDAKAQDDQLMSALRTEIGNDKYGTIDGELVSGDLTVGRFGQLKKIEQADLQSELNRARVNPEDTSATAARNIKLTFTSLVNMSGADSSKLDHTYDSMSWLKDPEYPEIAAQDIATRANYDVNKNFKNRDNYAKMMIRNNLARDMFLAKVYMDIKSNITDEDKLNTVLDNLGNDDTVKAYIENDPVAAFIIGLPSITKDAIKNNKDALSAILTDRTRSNYYIPITENYVKNVSEEKTDHHIYDVEYEAVVEREPAPSGQWGEVLTIDVMNNLFTDDGFLDVRKFGEMFGVNGTYGEDLITKNKINVAALHRAKLTRDKLIAALNSGKYIYDD